MSTIESLRTKSGLVQFLRLTEIAPSPENDTLYRPVNPNDPQLRALAKSIREHGVKEPIVVTLDHFILSGHRRYAAAKLARLETVPVRYEGIHRDNPNFISLLREYNRQREKTETEKLREEIVSLDPDEAYSHLREQRERAARVDVSCVEIVGEMTRASISKAKTPFLRAVIHVINSLREFWPLSVRQIHYQLLNHPPLIHASKPESRYENRLNCYKALSNLTARARLTGGIPMHVIADETRPVTLATGYETTTPFIQQEFERLLKGYYRNRQQTQPNHLEIVGEKNTIQGVLRPIAFEYTVPLTIGRGYCSLPPRYEIAERFRKSGKENLILLVLSDFDPDGEEICHSLARSLRDDFDIENIKPVKVALTESQVRDLNLVPSMEAKAGSSNYKKFTEKYGRDVYELEAVQPTALQDILRGTIESVMDMEAFESEIENEKKDAVQLDKLRREIAQALKESEIDLDGDEGRV